MGPGILPIHAIAFYNTQAMPTPEELNKAGMEAYKAGRYPEAIEAYEQAIAAKPDYVPCYMNLSLAYAKKGRPDDAIRVSQKAVELAPANGSVRYGLGGAFNAKGLWNEAVSAFTKAYELDKTQVNALYMAGCQCMDHAIDAKAKEFLKTFLASAPADNPRRKDAEERMQILEGSSSRISKFGS